MTTKINLSFSQLNKHPMWKTKMSSHKHCDQKKFKVLKSQLQHLKKLKDLLKSIFLEMPTKMSALIKIK